MTVGYVTESEAAPYAPVLAALLYAEGIEAETRGISGETTAEMLRRFKAEVIRPAPAAAIILGGSNDLGWGVPLAEVLENLEQMYRNARAARIVPIACSIPSLQGGDPYIPPRRALNEKIKKRAEGLGIPFADLFSATAETSPPYRLRADLTLDGLHLTAEGYRIFAGAIAPLIPPISRESSGSP